MFDYAMFAALLSERKNINSESTDELEIYYDKRAILLPVILIIQCVLLKINVLRMSLSGFQKS